MKSNPPNLPVQFLLELLGVPQGDRDFLATLEFFHIHYQLSNGCGLEEEYPNIKPGLNDYHPVFDKIYT